MGCFWTDTVGCYETCPLDPTEADLKGVWTQLSGGPPARNQASAVSINGQMYLFGGVQSHSFNDTWVYEPIGDKWTQLLPPTSPSARSQAGSAAINNKMYIFGGADSSGNCLSELWVYDPAENKWSQLTSCPLAVDSMACVTINNKLYIYGGWDGSAEHNSLWIYDPSSDGWSQGTSGPTSSSQTAVTINSKLYLFQSSDDLTTWCFDPLKNDWAQLAPMPTTVQKWSSMSCEVNSKMYVYGGPSTVTTGADKDLWCYNPAKDSWSVVAEGPVSSGDYAGCVIDGAWYLFGGDGLEANVLQKIT
jgi:N-acetylneuraminic acid mutarotase